MMGLAAAAPPWRMLQWILLSSLMFGQFFALNVSLLRTPRSPPAIWSTSRSTSPLLMTTIAKTERSQKLRSLNWIKQVKNELTSAEFALQLEGGNAFASKGDAALILRRKRRIDFERILSRLEKNLLFLEQGGIDVISSDVALSEDEFEQLKNRLTGTIRRISNSIEGRSSAKQEFEGKNERSETASYFESADDMSQPNILEEKMLHSDINGENETVELQKNKTAVPEFGLFVRDDGTVDWDGAIQSGREVAKFGKDLWERINGKDPHEIDSKQTNLFGGVKVKTVDPPQIQQLLDQELKLVEIAESLRKESNDIKTKLDLLDETADSNSRRELMFQARIKAESANLAERRVELHRLDTDMERISFCIEQDIKESATSPREHRLLVAEFGMLDAQLKSLTRLLDSRSGDTVDNPDLLFRFGEEITEEGSELELIRREIGDLKLRLGMNLSLDSPSFSLPDMELVLRYAKETVEKVKSAFIFCINGIKLLGQDVQYAVVLITKAVQGYTLKPREVRTLRRSGKDLLTLIPATIILILPLSPLGHVLVFSFIQRYFPNFFPSTFTERRQNLLKMYEEVEKVELESTAERGVVLDSFEDFRRKFVGSLRKNEK